MNRKTVSQIGSKAATARVEGASPHELILILFDYGIEKLAAAQHACREQNFTEKARHLCAASNIINGLKALTDEENGGDIAGNLQMLYSFSVRELRYADQNNDPRTIQEVTDLMTLLRSAWLEIPAEYHYYSAAGQRQAVAARH